MTGNKSKESTSGFSLHETAKPKFTPSQIRIDSGGSKTDLGLPKSQQKLEVRRSGRIGYAK